MVGAAGSMVQALVGSYGHGGQLAAWWGHWLAARVMMGALVGS